MLPNNKNIILAAEQAARLSSREAAVVPTTSVTQGLAALMGFNPLWDLEENVAKMNSSALGVWSGELTRAVRDTIVGSLTVREGDFIGLRDGDLVASGPEMQSVLADLLKLMIDDDSGLITLYYGGGLAGGEADALAENLRRLFPYLEVELHYGGQPLYQLIVSVE